jgi:hypothetical protein
MNNNQDGHGESDRGMFGFRETGREKMKENPKRMESAAFSCLAFFSVSHTYACKNFEFWFLNCFCST